MKPITIIIDAKSDVLKKNELNDLLDSALVCELIIVGNTKPHADVLAKHRYFAGSLAEGKLLTTLFEEIKTEYVFVVTATDVSLTTSFRCFERFHEIACATKSSIVYSDYFSVGNNNNRTKVFLNDYQLGSVRDDFDFGVVIFFNVIKARQALLSINNSVIIFSGIYALRLQMSVEEIPFHIRECLYTVRETAENSQHQTLFAYQDSQNKKIQRECELVFSKHLKEIGAFVEPSLKAISAHGDFPVEMSVIIPVKNRVNTVSDAVVSANKQKTTFPFNIIVVDNHSSDGTTELLTFMAKQIPRLLHVCPTQSDLEIGGCWNIATLSPDCGRYAVQLDSDDIYFDEFVLENIHNKFSEGNYAMVIGSYSLVDMNLTPIPPGLISHEEWTDANGHNNALRINGLGAPRAFNTNIVRQCGFPNVSYGEDYAIALRICREYKIGRIFENLYWCRRWEGNTDSSISQEAKNKNDAYKDQLRTVEIQARKQLNGA